MKNTEVDAMLAPASITVEGGGGWKFATLATPESRLPVPKILPMPSVAFFSYPKSGDCDYERWAFLPTSVMRVVRRHAHFRPLLCYPMPAAPLS